MFEFRKYSAIDLEHSDQRISNSSLILTAIMSGGDYDQVRLFRPFLTLLFRSDIDFHSSHSQKGSTAFGPTKGLALGRLGFGDKLVEAFKTLSPAQFKADFVPRFRAELAEELRTNASGELGRKFVVNANALTDDFINYQVLDSYVHPITSGSPGQSAWPGFVGKEVKGTLDGLGLANLGRVMEAELQWEGKDVAVKRAASNLYDGAIRRALMAEIVRPGAWVDGCNALGLQPVPVVESPRYHKMEEYFDRAGESSSSRSPVDNKKPRSTGPRPFGRGEFPFLLQIKKSRSHVSTGYAVIEYQCVFSTARLVRETINGLANEGILDPDRKIKPVSATTKARAKTKATRGRSCRAAAAAKSEEDGDDAEDFTVEMELAAQASDAVEAARLDGDFQLSSQQAEDPMDEADPSSDEERSSPTKKGKPFRADEPVVVWVALPILELAYPDHLAEFIAKEAAKVQKKLDVVEARAERERVKATKLAAKEQAAAQKEKQASLMASWVTKGAKPRSNDKGKAREQQPENDEDAMADFAAAPLLVRARSADAPRPVASSSRAPAPSSSQVIDLSDHSGDNASAATCPKSPFPVPRRSLSRVSSAQAALPAQPVASTSKLSLTRSTLQRGKSKTNLHPCPSPDALFDAPPPPSKLPKSTRSPGKRTLSRTQSAASASVPDILSDDDSFDGFDIDAFTDSLKAAKQQQPTTPSKRRAAAGSSPTKRIALEMERSLSPSPAGKEKVALKPTVAFGADAKGKGKASATATLKQQQEIFDLDSDATPKRSLPPFSSPPAKVKRSERAPLPLLGKKLEGGPSLRPGRPGGDVFSSATAGSGSWIPMDDDDE